MKSEEPKFTDEQVGAVLEIAADNSVADITYRGLVKAAKGAGIPSQYVEGAVQEYIQIQVKARERKSQGELEKRTRRLPIRITGADVGSVVGGVLGAWAYFSTSDDSAFHFYGPGGIAVVLAGVSIVGGHAIGRASTLGVYAIRKISSAFSKKD